jgi:hypothetical protein
MNEFQPVTQPGAATNLPPIPEQQNTGIMEAREQRIRAFESVLGQEGQAERPVGRVIVDAVRERLNNPQDTSKTRLLSRRHIFIELHGAKSAVDHILADHQVNPRDEASLAAALRPSVSAIYANRRGGKEEAQLLTDEQVINDAQDFSATVARELFLREYTKRVGKELKLGEQIDEVCGVGDPAKRVDRGKLMSIASKWMRARNRTQRELGRVSHRLKLTPEENRAVNEAFKAQYTNGQREFSLPQERLEEQKAHFKTMLEARTIARITGEEGIDPATRPDILEQLRAREDVFSDAATEYAVVDARKEHLRNVCKTLSPKAITREINDLRVAELRFKGLENTLKIITRREKLRLKLKGIAEEGVAKYGNTNKFSVASAATFAKELGASAKDLPGSVAQRMAGDSGRLGHNLAEGLQRPAYFLTDGSARIGAQVARMTEGQIDRVAGFARNVINEWKAWRGGPDEAHKIARSAAYYATVANVPTTAEAIALLLEANPQIARELNERNARQARHDPAGAETTPEDVQEALAAIPPEEFVPLEPAPQVEAPAHEEPQEYVEQERDGESLDVQAAEIDQLDQEIPGDLQTVDTQRGPGRVRRLFSKLGSVKSKFGRKRQENVTDQESAPETRGGIRAWRDVEEEAREDEQLDAAVGAAVDPQPEGVAVDNNIAAEADPGSLPQGATAGPEEVSSPVDAAPVPPEPLVTETANDDGDHEASRNGVDADGAEERETADQEQATDNAIALGPPTDAEQPPVDDAAAANEAGDPQTEAVTDSGADGEIPELAVPAAPHSDEGEAAPATEGLEAEAPGVETHEAVERENEGVEARLKQNTYNNVLYAMEQGIRALQEEPESDERNHQLYVTTRALQHFRSEDARTRVAAHDLKEAFTFTSTETGPDGNQVTYEMPYFMDLAIALEKQAQARGGRSSRDLSRAATLLYAMTK